MKKIRIRVVILISWLIFLFIADKLPDFIVISNITISLVFGMAIAPLLIPQMSKFPLWVMMLIPTTALLVTKLWTGGFVGGLAIFLTLIEICAIAVSTSLSRWVSVALNEFENAVANITLGQSEKRLESSISGQGTIYREVRRARNHQQPLSLISISVDEKSIDSTTEKLVQETQRSMMKQYKLRGLSKMLCDELEDCTVITQGSDHYLAALPDTMPEQLAIVVERLRQKACNQIGVEIKIGVATLPHDSYTFEGLLERATREMQNDREPQPCVLMEPYPLERRITQ